MGESHHKPPAFSKNVQLFVINLKSFNAGAATTLLYCCVQCTHFNKKTFQAICWQKEISEATMNRSVKWGVEIFWFGEKLENGKKLSATNLEEGGETAQTKHEKLYCSVNFKRLCHLILEKCEPGLILLFWWPTPIGCFFIDLVEICERVWIFWYHQLEKMIFFIWYFSSSAALLFIQSIRCQNINNWFSMASINSLPDSSTFAKSIEATVDDVVK